MTDAEAIEVFVRLVLTDEGFEDAPVAHQPLDLAHTEILRILKAQHEAIDRLFAYIILLTGPKPTIDASKHFMPSESGQPWIACQEGHALIERLEQS